MRIGTVIGKLAIGAAFIGIGAATTLALQQPEGTPPATPPATPDFSKMSKKELAAMMGAAAGRAAEHDRLEFMIGKSEHDIRMSMGPGVPEMTAKAVGEGEWTLGKRFVVTHSRPAPGEELPIESMNIFGYDTRKKEYFWIGLDTMGTYFVTAFGNYDEATKTFTLYGEETHEHLGKVRHRMLITNKGDGLSMSAIEFEMQPGSDTWSRMVEMNAKKVK